MVKKIAAAAMFVALAGCQKSDTKILIGATAVIASGQAPLADSVIVIAGKTIRAVGLQKDVPIPQDSERTDLAGKWVVPEAGGRIAAGEPANLLVLDHPPAGSAPPQSPAKRMAAGQWQ